jgi:phosphotransferase system enzyme I (PtsI)
MLARQRGVPAVVGVDAPILVRDTNGLLDAEAGVLTLHPDAASLQYFEQARARFAERRLSAEAFASRAAMTHSGRRVMVMVNLADPDETARIPVETVDGVGLMRTEFLFGSGLPDEESQFEAYRRVLDWAVGRPVTIRTVDAGADKPVPGFTLDEDNAFLGVRGIRLSLARPEVFAVQVRALLRAAVAGNLKVMLPMISAPDELDRAIALFENEAAVLASEGVPHAMPPLGIMVEVPAVALAPERFSRAAFYSIGTNDLTQYVFAAARDNGRVSHLARADDPTVLSLVQRVAAFGESSGKEVSVCGDAASEPDLVPHLLDAGIATLSVAASRIGLVKARIAMFDEREKVQG